MFLSQFQISSFTVSTVSVSSQHFPANKKLSICYPSSQCRVCPPALVKPLQSPGNSCPMLSKKSYIIYIVLCFVICCDVVCQSSHVQSSSQHSKVSCIRTWPWQPWQPWQLPVFSQLRRLRPRLWRWLNPWSLNPKGQKYLRSGKN